MVQNESTLKKQSLGELFPNCLPNHSKFEIILHHICEGLVDTTSARIQVAVKAKFDVTSD